MKKHLHVARTNIITIIILLLSCIILIYDFGKLPMTRDWFMFIIAEFCLQILYTDYNKT